MTALDLPFFGSLCLGALLITAAYTFALGIVAGYLTSNDVSARSMDFGYERDTHGMASNFRRGFDGWIYGCHGFNNLSDIADRSGNGGIDRYEPLLFRRLRSSCPNGATTLASLKTFLGSSRGSSARVSS